MRRHALLGALVLPLLGCRSAAPGLDVPPQPWAQMDHAARYAYMTATVQPTMAASFQAHDEQRYADFGCVTCHGPGAEDGSYAMPNPELPVLNRKTFREEHQKKHPEMVEFMWERVEVDMAALLGMKTGRRNFSCRSCHLRE